MIEMDVHLQDLSAHLAEISQDQWKKLFDLIPEIENTTYFGEVTCKDGIIYPSTWAEIVNRFHEYVYEIGLVVDFDWPHWDEGKQILSIEDPDLFKYPAVTLCKLLTAIVRSERFVEGNLIAYFEDGTILKILRALEKHYGNKLQ
ncbi:MAG: DUF6508 domain-containing protein [Sphaerochaeta sp.]|nr:DUF6508 domain-containing protein [Sphaerochaeta sp.]